MKHAKIRYRCVVRLLLLLLQLRQLCAPCSLCAKQHAAPDRMEPLPYCT